MPALQDAFAFADVLTGGADVVADRDLIADGDFAEGCAVGAALHLVGVFEGDYGVCAIGDGGAGHDADCVPGGYCDAGKLACSDCARDAECYGGVGGCAMHVGCLQGVAVHGGVVEGRDVVIREGVLGEHLPDCV